MSAAAGPTLESIRARKAEVERIAARYGASNVRVFGSVARGEADSRSDIDLLVDMAREEGPALDYFARLEDLRTDLSNLLAHPVDVTDSSALKDHIFHPIEMRAHKRFRDRIVRDLVAL